MAIDDSPDEKKAKHGKQMHMSYIVNQLVSPEQNGHFEEDIFKRIFVFEKVRILIKISLKFVSKDPINNKQALFWIMAWRRIGNKSLSLPLLTTFSDAYKWH